MENNRDRILDQFRCSADALLTAVGGRPERQLDWRLSDCEWSIRQIVHHLADDLDVWGMCIKKALATPGAVVRFEGFPGNQAWADGLHFERRAIQTQLVLILAQRQAAAALVEHFADAWDCTMQIADSEGKVVASLSVMDILIMLTDHMNEHMQTIREIFRKHDGEAGVEG
jgi:hypothetical protein